LWNTVSSQWSNYQKDEYAYDGSGDVILSSHYHWNSDSSLWHNEFDVQFIYDDNRKLTQKLTTFHEPFQEYLTAKKKTEYTYDPDGKLTQLINYTLFKDNTEWSGSTKEESIYDASGNKTQRIVTSWNNIEWENYMTFDYSYDINGNKIEETDHWWNFNNQVWVTKYHINWYYSEKSVNGLPGNRDLEILVYPNPATDQITIDTGDLRSATLELFDISGKHLISQTLSGRQLISVSHLQKGVYLYSIKSDQRVLQGKIIIR
jgi:hypothetical protein